MKQILITCLILVTLVSCTSSEDIIIAEGSIESIEVIVGAEGNGCILSLHTEEGTIVSKGEILGKIDDQQLVLKRQQLISTQQRIESQAPDIEVQVAALEEQLSYAKSEKSRISSLVTANAASNKQLDDINTQVKTLELQIAAQRLTLAQSTASIAHESASLSFQIAQLGDQITKCIIKSPIDGVVLSSYAHAGELATIGRTLFKVADLKKVYLRAYITAAQLTRLKLGDTIKVMVDYGESGTRNYEGAISWISEKAEFTPKTVQTQDERAALVYAIKVSLINDGYLKLGMYGAIVEGN